MKLAIGIYVALLLVLQTDHAKAPGEALGGHPLHPWEIVPAGTAAIAAPRGWREPGKPTPRTLLYREGAGTDVPKVDENNNPLRISLTVEKLDVIPASLDVFAESVAQSAQTALNVDRVEQNSLEPMQLADGTNAILLTMVSIREQRGLRALHFKLLSKDAEGHFWIVNGILAAGKESELPAPKNPLAQWLRAHVTSFVFDEKKMDEEKLAHAYAARGTTSKTEGAKVPASTAKHFALPTSLIVSFTIGALCLGAGTWLLLRRKGSSVLNVALALLLLLVGIWQMAMAAMDLLP